MDARFTCPPPPPLPPISWDTQVSLHVWINEYWGYLHACLPSILHLHMNLHGVHAQNRKLLQSFVWIISLSLSIFVTSFHTSEDGSTLRNLILRVIYVHRPVAPWEFSACWFLLTYITILWTCAPDSDLTVLICRDFSSCSMWVLCMCRKRVAQAKYHPALGKPPSFIGVKGKIKRYGLCQQVALHCVLW